MAVRLGATSKRQKLTLEWLDFDPKQHECALFVNSQSNHTMEVHFEQPDKFYVVFRDDTYKYFDAPRYLTYVDEVEDLCRILGFECGDSPNNDNLRAVSNGF